MSVTILQGDCRSVLPTLETGSVQCCVTSPPYWGLRSYLDADHPNKAQELGAEETPDAYVAAMVGVFREVRRVLRADGTLWLNIGDSYAAGGRGTSDYHSERMGKGTALAQALGRKEPSPGYKPKDLIGIPWMLAFALRADGWYLRSDIIWHKPNVMPESVTDRPTKAHEYLFLLTKAPRYYYDAEAIKEPAIHEGRIVKASGSTARNAQVGDSTNDRRTASGFTTHDTLVSGRNKRSVWTVATSPYPGAHFATFPEALIEPCILAGSSPQACEVCGAPWQRVVEIERSGASIVNAPNNQHLDSLPHGLAFDPTRQLGPNVQRRALTTGWQPTCTHDNAGTGRCVVLDPFFGSGTTGRVALRHGRQCIGIELSAAYIEQAKTRTDGVQTMLLEVTP